MKRDNWHAKLAKARNDKREALQQAMHIYAEKLEADTERQYWADQGVKSEALNAAKRLAHLSEGLVTAEKTYLKKHAAHIDLEREFNSLMATEEMLF